MNERESPAVLSHSLLTNDLRIEALPALAGIVVSIVGLAGMFAVTMAGTATVVTGLAMMLPAEEADSGWLPGRRRNSAPEENSWQAPGANFLGGLAAIVLGIFALLGSWPEILTGAAVITLGTAQIISGITLQAICVAAWSEEGTTENRRRGRVVFFGSTGQVLIAAGVVALGILAVIGLVPVTLVLVGLLSSAGAVLVQPGFHGRQGHKAQDPRRLEAFQNLK